MEAPKVSQAELLERLRSGAQGLLALSLLVFFVSVVLIGAEIGDPVTAENVASLSSLAVALSGFTYISLGLMAAEIAEMLSLPRAEARMVRSQRSVRARLRS